MINLYNYITNITNKIDGHIHLFDHSGTIYKYIDIPSDVTKVVGFMDVDFYALDKYEHDDVIKYYTNFIHNKKYDKNRILLLATGKDCDTMIDIYKKFPNEIKGFGEIKCYSYYKESKLDFGNLQWIRPLCDFNKDKTLPIYIHWYIYNEERANELDELLTDYPEIPFVLCHCGLSPKRDYKKQYSLLSKLLEKHTNLYVDVSYKPASFFIDNPEYLFPLYSRCLVGSDINIKSCKENKNDEAIKRFDILSRKNLNYGNTLKKLFRL